MARKLNILLIDDDRTVRQALGNALAVENYHVVPVASRREALHELAQQQIDMVLLDVHPRYEDGLETLRHLTAFQPGLVVIAMTARAEQQESMSGARAIDALMEKPLKLSVLIQTLNELSLQPSNCACLPTIVKVPRLENRSQL